MRSRLPFKIHSTLKIPMRSHLPFKIFDSVNHPSVRNGCNDVHGILIPIKNKEQSKSQKWLNPRKTRKELSKKAASIASTLACRQHVYDKSIKTLLEINDQGLLQFYILQDTVLPKVFHKKTFDRHWVDNYVKINQPTPKWQHPVEFCVVIF